MNEKEMIKKTASAENVVAQSRRVGAFTGTFDPFTVGHKDIVDRALPLFDELVICIAHNEKKQFEHTVEERMAEIRRLYKDEPRVKVDVWDGLTADYCQQKGIHYIIKGVRNTRDFEYERDQAEMNRHMTGVETILFYCDPTLSAVSSSMVKVLKSYGRDVSEFLP